MNDKIKIGIVDDHALFRKSLSVLINMFSQYEVVIDAANGQDLISLLNLQLPDIILMDINMPVMDGYTATAWLRINHPDINVLALSTMDSENAIIKMIKSGAKGYVLKDAEPQELRQAFEDVTEKGYYYNEMVTRKVMNSINQLTDKQGEIGLFIKLSEREIEFLRFSCTELSYKEIADRLCVSARTVEGYRDSLCEKLNLKTRVGLAMYAIKNHIAEP